MERWFRRAVGLVLLWLGAAEASLGRGEFALKQLHVVSAIRMRFATTQVTQRVLNLTPLPAVYHFVAYFPPAAHVSNLTMSVFPLLQPSSTRSH